MGLIKPDEWVVMLDECGQDLGSEQMASLIGDAGNKDFYFLELEEGIEITSKFHSTIIKATKFKFATF
ncbi:hypothetical protein K7X08_027474 [Anisodus acutangulus]|uniref:Uncharacterized protein n=1 Tax=Anisodus acutangulus TaxID=402998 RepID=A0A9Q1RL11_9SOLA|nr:hypothetical protein K7X08_027474 [Anisodus acutangulus]